MTQKISKTNADLAYFNSRLDEIRMSGHERLKAKARLAQAEAMAGALAAVFAFAGRAVKQFSSRSSRRQAATVG